jgi:hypothetical protein
MTAVWINQLLQGVMLGGLYTLFAIGLSLSAGTSRAPDRRRAAGPPPLLPLKVTSVVSVAVILVLPTEDDPS